MTAVSVRPQALVCNVIQERLGAPCSTSLPLDRCLHCGQWGRILLVKGPFLYETAEFRAQVFSTTLNKLLEDDGVPIRYADPDHKGKAYSEVKGSNPEARDYFSTASAQAWRELLNYEAEHGHPPKTRREWEQIWSRVKGAKTTEAKMADVLGNEQQAARWRQSLVDAGIELTITDIGKPVERAPVDERLDTLFGLLDSKIGVVLGADDQAPVFGPEVILPAAWRLAESLGFRAEEIEAAAGIYRDTRLVVVRDAVDPSARLYTTQSIVTNETKIVNRLDSLAAGSAPSVRREVVDAVIWRQKHAPDSGQRELIRAICSGSQLVHGVGHAGAGKGFALDIAVEALRESGAKPEIVATAVAAKRADELARQLGADRRGSIESLHCQYGNGWRPGRNTVIILDEAALASTFDMAKLLEVVGTKAKLILIGDNKQGVAIGPAGWYGQELAKRPAVELTKVYRQADPEDRKTLELIRQGDASVALARLEEQGRIHVVEEAGDLAAKLAERYARHRSSGRLVQDIAIVHQGSNSELDAYNRIIQTDRARHGEVDRTESYVVGEASTGRRWMICQGDRIVMNKGVSEGLSEPVRNGQTGTVVRVGADGAVLIRFDGQDRRTATIRLKPEMDVVPVGLGYVMSTAKYQGGQAPVVLITPGSPEIASQNSGYSQTTRMVNHVEVLVDRERWDRGEGPIKALGQAWSQEQTKHLASELLPEVDLDEVQLEDVPEIDHEFNETERLIDELRREIDERERDTGWELGF